MFKVMDAEFLLNYNAHEDRANLKLDLETQTKIINETFERISKLFVLFDMELDQLKLRKKYLLDNLRSE